MCDKMKIEEKFDTNRERLDWNKNRTVLVTQRRSIEIFKFAFLIDFLGTLTHSVNKLRRLSYNLQVYE